MEPDLVLEVPDTPDRLANLVNRPSRQSVYKEAFKAKADPPASLQNIDHTEEIFACNQRDLDGRNVSISSTVHDTNYVSRQARLAQSLSDALDKKPLPDTPLELRQNGLSTGNQERPNEDDSNHGNPLNFSYLKRCRNSRKKMEKELLTGKREFIGSRRNCEFLGVGSSLPPKIVGHHCSRSGVSVSQKKAISPEYTHADIKFRDKGKGINLCSDSQPKPKQELSSALDRKPLLQKRLVRNGCISPSNIAMASVQSKVHCQHGMTSFDRKPLSSKSVIGHLDNFVEIDSSDESQPRHRKRRLAESCSNSQNSTAESMIDRNSIKDEGEKMVFIEVPSGIFGQIQGCNPNSKDGHGYSNKGKATADDLVTNGQIKNAILPSTSKPHRRAQIAKSGVSDSDGDILGSQDLGWKRTNRQTENATRVLSSEIVCIRKTGQSSSHHLDHCDEVERGTMSHFSILVDSPEKVFCRGSNSTSVQQFSNWDSESRRKRPIGDKRKYSLTSNSGESSNSSLDDSEISYLRRKSSNLRSSRTHNSQHHGIVLRPITEIDELLSPEATGSYPQEQGSGVSKGSNATTRQVEADELLARQLQEQLYNESPARGNREEIDEAIALSLQQEENTLRASSASRRSRSLLQFRQARNSINNAHYRSRPSPAIVQLLRDIDLRGMDIDMRLNLFEELESEFNNHNGMAFLHTQRDFNENDYEALLALDDSNHQHSGASENQINNLPLSMVQTSSVEEPCAVCLEKPSFGDTIRHLPCLHKFHKDCIDQWLRRKTSCPVCKCGIT